MRPPFVLCGVWDQASTQQEAHTIKPILNNVVKGPYLTRQELRASYAIIRHNVRTYLSAGVVSIVQGKRNAEAELKKLADFQHSADRHEGWRYFLEKTDLKAGTDPLEATRKRQVELERRESKALQKT